MRTESLTDPLTTLANRKYFDAALAQGIAEATAKNEPLSLLMADIDHFKSFNDRFGHLTGDQVLRLVALSVKQNVKNQDVAARYGGEEFVIALPNTPLRLGNGDRRPYPPRGHDQRADETIERRTARPRDDLDRRRACCGRRDNAPLLIERADKCLYAAKRNGRNRVICETDPEAKAETMHAVRVA